MYHPFLFLLFLSLFQRLQHGVSCDSISSIASRFVALFLWFLAAFQIDGSIPLLCRWCLQFGSLFLCYMSTDWSIPLLCCILYLCFLWFILMFYVNQQSHYKLIEHLCFLRFAVRLRGLDCEKFGFCCFLCITITDDCVFISVFEWFCCWIVFKFLTAVFALCPDGFRHFYESIFFDVKFFRSCDDLRQAFDSIM